MPTGGTSWLRRAACPFDKPLKQCLQELASLEARGGTLQQNDKRCTCRYRHARIHIPDDDPKLYEIRRAAKRNAVDRDYEESRLKILKTTWRMWIAAIKMQRAARTVGDLRYVRLATLQFKRHALAALRWDLIATRLAERLAIQGYVSRQLASPG